MSGRMFGMIGARAFAAAVSERKAQAGGRARDLVDEARYEEGAREVRGRRSKERERAARARSAAAGRREDGIILERQQVRRLQDIATARGRAATARNVEQA